MSSTLDLRPLAWPVCTYPKLNLPRIFLHLLRQHVQLTMHFPTHRTLNHRQKELLGQFCMVSTVVFSHSESYQLLWVNSDSWSGRISASTQLLQCPSSPISASTQLLQCPSSPIPQPIFPPLLLHINGNGWRRP